MNRDQVPEVRKFGLVRDAVQISAANPSCVWLIPLLRHFHFHRRTYRLMRNRRLSFGQIAEGRKPKTTR